MNELPNLCYYNNDEYNFTKPYSDQTAQLIDEEVKHMIAEQYERAKSLLREHQDGHAELAKVLVEREVIFAEDVEKIFGKRPWTSRTEELLSMNEELPGDEMAQESDEQKEEQGAPASDEQPTETSPNILRKPRHKHPITRPRNRKTHKPLKKNDR